MSSEGEITPEEKVNLETLAIAQARADVSLASGRTIGETGFIGWRVISPKPDRSDA